MGMHCRHDSIGQDGEYSTNTYYRFGLSRYFSHVTALGPLEESISISHGLRIDNFCILRAPLDVYGLFKVRTGLESCS